MDVRGGHRKLLAPSVEAVRGAAVRCFVDAVLDGLTVMVTTAAPILAIVGLYKLLELAT